MFYIYVKKHNKTGLRYLGYTKRDPFKYLGSGVYWLRHLDAHGYDVSTEILCECSSKEEVKIHGRFFSKFFDVVESEEWANIKIEEADGGDMRTSKKWMEGRTSPDFKKKQSEGASGNTNVRGTRWWICDETGEKKRSKQCPGDGWRNGFEKHTEERKAAISKKLTGVRKTEEHKERLRNAAKGRESNSKGTIWVKNSEGKRKRVRPDDIPEGFFPVNKIEHHD